MAEPEYRQALAQFIQEQAKPADKFSHQPRLYRLAKSLGQGRPFDDDVLYAAAWLHDIGVFIGHRPVDPLQLAAWDHIAYALGVVPDLLQRFGFPQEKITPVLEAIRTHLPSAQPTSLEGTLLREADILEQLGAIGILRTVSKVGRDTRYPTHHAALATLTQAARELPSRLSLPLARQMGEERLRLMMTFFAAVQAEAEGQL